MVLRCRYMTNAPSSANSLQTLLPHGGVAKSASMPSGLLVMDKHGIMVQMRDQTDWEMLGRIAEGQAGYVTPAQARTAGFHRNTLLHHAREEGRLEKTARGLYRLRFYPRSQFEPIAAAWVQTDPERAVVSHESALELYGLSDVAPSAVHLTLPRDQRWRRPATGMRFHLPRHPLRRQQVRRIHGMPTTTPERTIIDVLESGTQPEQVEQAVKEALARGLTTKARLRAASAERSATTRRVLEQLIAAS